ncbi:hypothetical protein XO10_09655 [Marinitoga sp. 1135]|uniref:Tetratricopeptide repeat protein n=1 Tax=Marinitoga piezophila (strain DSM 14283 / JCM 11233 / KA3) TaxID=443254 RepID=H2J6Q0_MARPK|nr:MULTISPECIES: hypothetical protein [Marinitoga]AEX86331.1 hypothetical protein Marpi_1953 [Marinitoga piezophila KA3]APT76729.1 hypothetical protein LN42_10350 [Marinitoga sp. 1137]NUU96506.1 hypothetical protein [Marinitoga sp. 1135]NUU98425.1 hypothetical protein [Marinitoga sp. 1138]
MKKAFLLLLITVYVVIGINAENIAETYLKTFDITKLMDSENVAVKTFAYFELYYEKNYSGYLKAANELRAKYNNLLTYREKEIFDIMSGVNPITTLKPIERFKELLKKYPDDPLINILLLEFEYKQWKITGDPKLAKEILNKIEYIEKKYGNTPFSIYYKSNFLFKSRIYGNKEDAYNLIKNGVKTYPDNRKIIETYIKIAGYLEKYKEDKELFGEIAHTYIDMPEPSMDLMLIIVNYYIYLNDTQKAEKTLKEIIIPNTRNSKILALSYELLGDISETYTQKMNYYKKALQIIPDNGRVLSKWALAMLKVDREKYKTLARISLNKALTIDGKLSDEAEKALEDLRNEIKIHVMLNYVLPLVLFVVVALGIIIFYEKWKEKKEMEKLQNEIEGENEDGRN